MKNVKKRGTRILTIVMILFILNFPLISALNLSNVLSTNITENSVVITWQTNETADSFVSYGTNQTTLTTVGDAQSVLNHSFALVNLLEAATYYFKVKSGAVEDNNSGSLYSFTTLNLTDDTTAPTIKANISSTVLDSKMDIFGETEKDAQVSLIVNGIAVGKKTALDGNFSFVDVRLKADSLNLIELEAEDKSGNKGNASFTVFSDVSKPKITLAALPNITTNVSFTLTGTISENATLSVLIDNRSAYNAKDVKVISASISLKEGENNVTVTAEDASGQKDEVKFKITLDSKPPTITADLVKGNSFYQGRAETDVTGVTKPGSKVYLYFFRKTGYDVTPDFSRAYEVLTADANGNFTFSGVDFEHPPITLKDFKPKEIPVGLKDVIIYALDSAQEQQQWSYEVYLIAEDDLGRSNFWKQMVTVYTCYTAETGFHVDPLPQFTLPAKLDPAMLDDGRQTVSALINLSYIGSGVRSETEAGFKVLDVKLEKACTPGMLTDTGIFNNFQVSCKVFPNTAKMQPNPEKTAWFMTATLARSDDLSKRKDDFWNDFKDRQMVIPLKLRISYQEREANGQWSTSKVQTSCMDLGYFVDIPLDSKELIPDFLADEGVTALNATIDAIGVVLPYLQKAMLVTGIGCGISIVAKLATRWYRLFMSKFEPVLTKLKEKKCPSGKEQDALFLKSTLENSGGNIAAGDKGTLDELCPMTTKAWQIEGSLQTALRWVCDRFLCHEAPAGWTETKSDAEILTAKINEQACGSQAGRGVPLTEIKDCKKHIKEHPNEISPTARNDVGFLSRLGNSSGNICYVDGKGDIYYVDMKQEEVAQAQETGLWRLQSVGNRFTIAVGQSAGKQLVAFKPKDAKDFLVGVDTTCEKLCTTKTGYSKATDLGTDSYAAKGCYPVNKDGTLSNSTNLNSSKGTYYIADFTSDCFPSINDTQKDLRTCICKQNETKGVRGKEVHIAEPQEEWSYRQSQMFRETGGNENDCSGGTIGTCYAKYRYYSGRDLPAAFGQSHVIDLVSGSEDITEVNPFTQHLGAFQAVCLSGIYNRLRMLQSILIGMRNCIVEAKHTGLTDAGQCKEIFSQAVCGLIYKVIAYAAKGCLPIPFGNIGQEGNESVWAQGVQFGLGAVQDTLSTSMNDLQAEYGNAKLNEFVSTGAQGVVRNICLAAFGYDWPYGMDFLMDAAYSTPMKTTPLIFPAERELTSYDPTKGTAIYNYRVGASLFPGCQLRSYTVKLKCIGKEDLGRENVKCEKYEDCPCVAAEQTVVDTQKEYLIHSEVAGVKPGSYVSVPIKSPVTVDSLFRYDHVVIEMQLDRFEDASKCFDSQHVQGNTAVFYAPITDVSATPLVSCKADIKTGKFTCPELTSFFGAMGNTYLEPPFVQCWDKRSNNNTGDWRNCDALNNFLLGDEILIRPNLFTDGKKQCMFVTLPGVTTTPNIYPIPEGLTGTYRLSVNLGTVTEALLGGTGTENLVTTDASGGSCSPGQLGKTGEPITIGSAFVFTYNKDTTKNTYRLTVPTGAVVETAGYSVTGGTLYKGTTADLTDTEIKGVVFKLGGYRVNNIFDPSASASSGTCK
ncbi:MAG: hypothetical protein ABIA37_04320, partial [Candidatus Woesearchaeota archaeon]